MHTTRTLALALAAGCLLAASACSAALGNDGKKAGQSTQPGITDTSITIGNSIAYSGPASSYSLIAQASQAYFASVNKTGGVAMGDGHRRTIQMISLDDAFNPAQTLQNTKELVDKDHVFALFAVSGTAPNLAIWDYTTAHQIPQIFCGGGYTQFASSAHPNVIGFQPTYTAETTAYVQYLEQHKPKAKVAVLYEDDGLGQSYLDTLAAQTKGTGISVVSKQSYAATDVDVTSQMARLADSGADTLLIGATPKFAAQAIGQAQSLGWHPTTFLSAASASVQSVLQPAGFGASEGIITAAYIKDPADKQWANDKAMAAYRSWARTYAPKLDPDNFLVAYGYTVAQALANTLETLKTPTRAALEAAVDHLDQTTSLLLPGIRLHTTPQDRYPITSLQLEQFRGGAFHLIGNVVSS